ncbi:hypothetical protein EYF80_025451 [Liparis tanakae]|uniref:Uncharacterized protein n=1 Tax=Liparis tanakae TaxID=230148 RepID=A0A4Z2HFF1_9TELE|nr:hypothetical protein EYF80_025451 [Liparis tanakae]
MGPCSLSEDNSLHVKLSPWNSVTMSSSQLYFWKGTEDTDLSRTSSLAAPLGDSLLLKGMAGLLARCRLRSTLPSMLW